LDQKTGKYFDTLKEGGVISLTNKK
jgi:hypothetical protein